MTEQDKNKMAEIIANLVLKNFAVHGDMKLAKEQAFNTIYKESPKVMWWFLNQY